MTSTWPRSTGGICSRPSGATCSPDSGRPSVRNARVAAAHALNADAGGAERRRRRLHAQCRPSRSTSSRCRPASSSAFFDLVAIRALRRASARPRCRVRSAIAETVTSCSMRMGSGGGGWAGGCAAGGCCAATVVASQIHAMTVMSGRRLVEQVLQDLDDAEWVERLDQMAAEAELRAKRCSALSPACADKAIAMRGIAGPSSSRGFSIIVRSALRARGA